MGVRISGISKSERNKFLSQSNEILKKTKGPLRLDGIVDRKNHQQVLFLRERTLGEFFWEKLIMTPQEMEDVENEALAALELAFFSLTDGAECGIRKGEGKDRRGNLVNLEESRQPRWSSDQVEMNNDDDNGCGKGQETDWNREVSLCKELLRSRILKESESKFEKDKNDPDVTSSQNIQTSHGLFTVPKGISVSICPALQVIAHNTIVSNVKVDAMPKFEPFSPIERAVHAFKDGWSAVSRRLSVMPARLYSVPLMPGLRHIEKLFCFADNSKRTTNDVLAENNREFWKNFYLKSCSGMKGSIVMGLYPDFYSKDKRSGLAVPFYSENNIQGAVDAAIELVSKEGLDGYEPVSFMFAEKDVKLAEAIAEEIKSRRIKSPNSVKTETGHRKCSHGQANHVAASIGAVELTGVEKKAEEKKNGDNISPEREFIIRELRAKKDEMKKKKLQKISAQLFELPKEDLVPVLGSLDQSILNEAFKLVSLTASSQTTPPKPFRPILTDNLPTPGKKTLKLAVRQALVGREEKFKAGSTPLWERDTAANE